MAEKKNSTYLGKSIQEWIKALKSDDPVDRRLAVYALGEIGPEAKKAIPGLTAALSDPESWVSVWAAAALAKVDNGNKEAIASLAASLEDKLYFVRTLAVWHLSRLGCDMPGVMDIFSKMEKLVEDPDKSVSHEAQVALKRLHSRKKVTH